MSLPFTTNACAQPRANPSDREDLVKGYEYEKGQFVVLSKDDFKTAALEKTKTVDILDFVSPDEIDERYFETPYYLQPGKLMARLRASLEGKGGGKAGARRGSETPRRKAASKPVRKGKGKRAA